jgi:hypothetical protein
VNRQFHPDFLEEMLFVSRFFEEEGDNPFVRALEETIDEACLFPLAAPKTKLDWVRKKSIGKYEYHLVYEPRDNVILFFAIAHKRRHPFYWLGRLEN